MAKFCFQCGKPLPGPVKFCPHCGALIAADSAAVPPAAPTPPAPKPTPAPTPAPPPPPAPVNIAKPAPAPVPAMPIETPPIETAPIETAPDVVSPNSRAPWLVAIAIVAIALSGLTYAILSSKEQDIAAEEDAAPAVEQRFYAAADAIIRERPTTQNSQRNGEIPRGQSVAGFVETGVDGQSRWLRLSDGRGYVGMVNLTSAVRPPLVLALDNHNWFIEAPNTLYENPVEGSKILGQLAMNDKVVLAGVTDNNFAEVKRPRGGVGYFPIRPQDDIGSLLSAKPRAINATFDPAGCDFGSDISAIVQVLARTKQQRAQANPLDTQTDYIATNFDYGGLHVTGVGLHYEGTSLHFTGTLDSILSNFARRGFPSYANPDYSGNVLWVDEGNVTSVFPAGAEDAKYGAHYLYCGL